MKVVAVILISLVVFFILQPLASNQILVLKGQVAVAVHCCATMTRQKNAHPDNHTGECEGNGCNPFMTCAYCHFCLVESQGTSLFAIIPEKEKVLTVNDNRLSQGESTFWHPPESLPSFG